MASVTGNLKQVTGSVLSANVGQLVFRLNGPNVVATGTGAGNVHPTRDVTVTPGTDGSFSVGLAETTGMFLNAWYDIGIRWNDSEGTFWDFGLTCTVPAGGPHSIADLITGGPGGAGGNGLLVKVQETQPKAGVRGHWWFQPSSNNLYRWE